MSELGDKTSTPTSTSAPAAAAVKAARRVPVTAMAALATLAVACTMAGLWMHRNADASRDPISSEATAALRQIDGLRDRSAEAEDPFSDWYMGATEPQVQAVLQQLADCQARGGCQNQRQAAYPVLQQAVATWIESAYAKTQSRRNIGDGLVLLALVLMGLLAGLALFSRPTEKASPQPPASDLPASAWATQALEQRSQQLFAAQLKAYEGDRFAAFGEIAAALSHGLKTPLASIRAAAQLAQAKLDDASPVLAQLDDIVEAVDRAVAQVQRHLKASGAVALQPRPVALSSLIRQVGARAQASCQSRGVAWSARDDQTQLWCSGDEELLLMAIQNLVDNAIAATPAGGEVLIQTLVPLAEESGEPMTGWVEIQIADRGPGLDPRVAAGSETSSSKVEGSGLGLSISRRIVTRHGGRLELERREGGGTVARLILPGQVQAPPEAST